MFLDIAFGIGGALVFVLVTGQELNWWLVPFCIVFALLPDADFVWHLVRHRRVDRFSHRHREILHAPCLLLPLVFFVTLPLGSAYATLATALVFVHFVHDSIGIGWGVRWFFPFQSDYFKFFDHGRLLTVRSPEQVAHAAKVHGDDEWFKNIYLRPSKTLIFEGIILLFMLVSFIIFSSSRS